MYMFRTMIMCYIIIFFITNILLSFCFFFQAEDGIRDLTVTGVQTWLFRSRWFPHVLPGAHQTSRGHHHPARWEGAGVRCGGLAPVSAVPAHHLRQHLLRPPFPRSEEHTSELQSQSNLVCRLLLEKKKKYKK